MRRTITFVCLLALAVFSAACGSDNTNSGAGNGNATRNGVIETNANINPKANGNSVPSNTAVLTGDNGNANTAGIRSTNTGNTHSGNMNSNAGNHNTGNKHP